MKSLGVITLFHVHPYTIPRVYIGLAVQAFYPFFTYPLSGAVEGMFGARSTLYAPFGLGTIIPNELYGILLRLWGSHVRYEPILRISEAFINYGDYSLIVYILNLVIYNPIGRYTSDSIRVVRRIIKDEFGAVT
tara:strand:+ start:508 stop:909 length:402 start_codon:yes stop_codon:yes gene_type:complete